MSDRAKIRARRVTGNDAQQQREVAQAIKNAREMALLPYTNRVTQSRTGGGGRGRDRDREASEGPMPMPAAPPPSPAGPPPARGDEGAEAPEVDVTEAPEAETVDAGGGDA
jgi:small subunit ribosomal protein S18